MRNDPQNSRRARSLLAGILIAACLSLAGCRQWATHDKASDAAKVQNPKKFNLDSLRDERAVAVERHLDNKSAGPGVPSSGFDWNESASAPPAHRVRTPKPEEPATSANGPPPEEESKPAAHGSLSKQEPEPDADG
ncbi:MAG TPA: hypothetical protein VGJ26_04180 [Pirellulales bacterium]|jgi:hypothetical protein